MKYSVGIGLTNDCNLACAHCYRDTVNISYVTLDQIKTICESIEVGSLGMGTGENILNPQFIPIVEYLHGRGVKLNVASNGFTVMSMDDDHLRMFNDVELSIDFPTRAEQDAFRDGGNWGLCHAAIERCKTLGVKVSILACLMRINYDKMDALGAYARDLDVNLRVNAYQAVKTDKYKLTFDEFWEGYKRLFSATRVVSCYEPVVRAAMGFDDVQSPCARTSIRFNQRGQVIPCVYWPLSLSGMTHPAPTIADLPALGDKVMEAEDFVMARYEPEIARFCKCQGGCATRRALHGQLDAHDDYCPWVRGIALKLDWEPAPDKGLMRGRNVCTTIVC
jgi:MoaA/NifB/PqqE/SkfB family radical SAM enzyme